MLLIFLFTLSSCKTISVSVKGYIPEQLHGVKKNYDPDLYLIEESFRYKPKIVPENFTEYYFFESKIPQIFVYQRNDFLITDPLVFVPQGDGADLLAGAALVVHGAVTVLRADSSREVKIAPAVFADPQFHLALDALPHRKVD